MQAECATYAARPDLAARVRGIADPWPELSVGDWSLVPIEIDREANRGRYVEPNVWMGHSLRGA
jgi:hypothetical protein